MSGRKAKDVTSSYVKVMREVGEKNIVFWADNCTGQNKNYILYTALLHEVNTESCPETVTIKYLEKGHTFMAADSVHGAIGRSMKRHERISDFGDFSKICDTATKSTEVLLMSPSDFYSFSSGCRPRTTRGSQELPTLGGLCEVRFIKGQSAMYYKCSFSEEYKDCLFLRNKFDLFEYPETLNAPRGIPGKKLEGIVKLLKNSATANSKLKFWNEMQINDNVPDLQFIHDNV